MFKILALVACTCLALPAATDDGAKPSAHQGQWRGKVMQKYDADHDGKLSESERATARADLAARMKERHPKLFAKIDSNGDGQLSADEMRAAREKLRAWREHRGEHGAGDGK